MDKMSVVSRIVLVLASLCFLVTYFQPFWFIYLTAPQYPEGLTMNIWLNKLSGQVEIINGLNHYIGMKHIRADMFPEFKFLVYVIALFIVSGIVVAWIGRRKYLLQYIIAILVLGAAAMIDFYKWGYDYGHHLDPTAPIQVPGLYYQPPLFGHKQLLNFDAYSYPDNAGWIVVCIVSVMIGIYFLELRQSRSTKSVKKVIT